MSASALHFDAGFNPSAGGCVYNANPGTLDITLTKSASLVEGGNIPCEDLISFQSRCIRNDAC
jgi:hypothetical protein